jgi:hypothetical protein
MFVDLAGRSCLLLAADRYLTCPREETCPHAEMARREVWRVLVRLEKTRKVRRCSSAAAKGGWGRRQAPGIDPGSP